MGLLIDPHLCLFLASMDQTYGKLINLFFSSVACIATIIDVNLIIFYLFFFFLQLLVEKQTPQTD